MVLPFCAFYMQWMVDESELHVIHYTLGPLKPWDWWTSWLLKPVDIWQVFVATLSKLIVLLSDGTCCSFFNVFRVVGGGGGFRWYRWVDWQFGIWFSLALWASICFYNGVLPLCIYLVGWEDGDWLHTCA